MSRDTGEPASVHACMHSGVWTHAVVLWVLVVNICNATNAANTKQQLPSAATATFMDG